MNKNKNEKSPTKLFIKVFVIAVVIGLVLCGAGFAMLFKQANNNINNTDTPEEEVVLEDKNPFSFVANLIKKEKDFNMAILGVDKDGTRTDVMFVMKFDVSENEVSMLSVPRDTRVVVCDEAKEIMKAQGYYVPYECKINEVHSFAKERGVECAVAQLEDLLGIEIDYYGKINIEGFRELIDEIGGVDMDVPSDMYYVDSTQGLRINLKAGPQHLDGAAAEQLVRFRSYKLGDVQRVEVQQLFLKEVAKKLLDPATIKSNIAGYIKIFTKYVDTDFSLSALMKYSDNFSKVNAESIVMETLPGAGGYVGDISYYLVDEKMAPEAIERIFFKGVEKDKSDSRNFRNYFF